MAYDNPSRWSLPRELRISGLPRWIYMDEVDVYGTFTLEGAKRLGVVPASSGVRSVESCGEGTSEKAPGYQAGEES